MLTLASVIARWVRARSIQRLTRNGFSPGQRGRSGMKDTRTQSPRGLLIAIIYSVSIAALIQAAPPTSSADHASATNTPPALVPGLVSNTPVTATPFISGIPPRATATSTAMSTELFRDRFSDTLLTDRWEFVHAS